MKKQLSPKTLANMGRLALLAAALIWGTSFVIMKNTVSAIPTMYLLAIRFTASFLILLIPCIKNLRKLDGKYILSGLAMGSCLFAAYIAQTNGLILTTPGKNAFLTAVYCVMVPFLYWIYKRQKPSRYNFIAAFVCLVGIGLVSLGKDLSINAGDLMTLLGGVFFAIHIIIIYEVSRSRSPLMLTMLQFFFAALLSWAGAFIFEEFPSFIPTEALWSLAYLCVGATCLTFLLQSFGQKYSDPSSTAVLLTLESVFGVLYSVLMGERLTVQIAIGFALIFIAVIISETRLSFLKKKI